VEVKLGDLGPHLDATLRSDADGSVLHLRGEVDLTAAPGLSAVIGAVAGGTGRLRMDLADVTFVDLHGARAILAAAHDHGIEILVGNEPRSLRIVLQVLGEAGARIRLEGRP